jgi:hypothetical protein
LEKRNRLREIQNKERKCFKSGKFSRKKEEEKKVEALILMIIVGLLLALLAELVLFITLLLKP